MAGADGIFIGRGQGSRSRRLPLAPRHGLIAGAAGTGRTVTLQVLAEGFSAAGVPVFAADPRGVLSGLAEAAKPDLRVRARADGRPCIRPAAFPVTLLDPLAEQGLPLRTTVSEIGPLVLARLFGLNDTQARVLERAFALADERGWLLLDLKDLRALLHFMSENTRELSGACGRVG